MGLQIEEEKAGKSGEIGKKRIGRFATGPLRRYADILAQKQIYSILKDIKPMTKKEVSASMSWIKYRRSHSTKLRDGVKSRSLLEAFTTTCANQIRLNLSGEKFAIISAVATGVGTEVFIPDAGLNAYIKYRDSGSPTTDDTSTKARLSSSSAAMPVPGKRNKFP